MSRPLQVYVDERELAQLEAWSRDRGWTKSQTIRVALRALTSPVDEDPLLAASGTIHGLPPNLSAQVGRALQETFVATSKPRVRKPGTKTPRAKSRLR